MDHSTEDHLLGFVDLGLDLDLGQDLEALALAVPVLEGRDPALEGPVQEGQTFRCMVHRLACEVLHHQE